MALVYDPRRAADGSGDSRRVRQDRKQIGRLMHHFDFDITTIAMHSWLAVDDVDRPTLFTVADVRAALHEIDDTIDLDEIAPLVHRPAADGELGTAESAGRLDDVRLLQRRIRQHAEPATIAALASRPRTRTGDRDRRLPSDRRRPDPGDGHRHRRAER